MPTTVKHIVSILDTLAPPFLAESWDRIGLQVGSPEDTVSTLVVCLDIRQSVVDEAIDAGANLIIAHHPLIFRPLESVRWDRPAGRKLRDLIQHGISVYVLHTNLDNAQGGLNDWLAGRIGLDAKEVFSVRHTNDTGEVFGTGRICEVPPMTWGELVDLVKERLKLVAVRTVGEPRRAIRKIAVFGGSGGDMIDRAIALGVDVLVKGDIKHHDAIDALEAGLCIIDAGHFGTEHIMVSETADYLERQFRLQGLKTRVKRSSTETDPFSFV